MSTSHNPPRPYNLDDPADLARLFREMREHLSKYRVFNDAIRWRRLATIALDDLICRMEGLPPAPPVCPECFGDREVRVPTDHGEWDDVPCEACNPHDMFGRPLPRRADANT